MYSIGEDKVSSFQRNQVYIHVNDDIIPVEEGYPLVWFCACASHWPCCQGKAGLREDVKVEGGRCDVMRV